MALRHELQLPLPQLTNKLVAHNPAGQNISPFTSLQVREGELCEQKGRSQLPGCVLVPKLPTIQRYRIARQVCQCYPAHHPALKIALQMHDPTWHMQTAYSKLQTMLLAVLACLLLRYTSTCNSYIYSADQLVLYFSYRQFALIPFTWNCSSHAG